MSTDCTLDNAAAPLSTEQFLEPVLMLHRVKNMLSHLRSTMHRRFKAGVPDCRDDEGHADAKG